MHCICKVPFYGYFKHTLLDYDINYCYMHDLNTCVYFHLSDVLPCCLSQNDLQHLGTFMYSGSQAEFDMHLYCIINLCIDSFLSVMK